MFKSLFGSSPLPQAQAPQGAQTPQASGPSLLDRLKAGIQKTRAGLLEKIEDAVSGRKEIDADVLNQDVPGGGEVNERRA